MNLIKKSFATAALGLALVGAASGVAQAAPADNPLPLTPVASPQENQAAQVAFNTQLGTAVAVGGFAGTVTGAAIGCGAGAALGLPFAILPGALGGCLAGAGLGAGIGGVGGTIAAGGPTLVVAGNELLQTFNAAPGTSKWAQ